MALMGLASRATRESQANRVHREILAKGVVQDFQGFVTSLCAIRPTISGNTTAKDHTSDDVGVREVAFDFKTEISAAKAVVTS